MKLKRRQSVEVDSKSKRRDYLIIALICIPEFIIGILGTIAYIVLTLGIIIWIVLVLFTV